MPYATCLGLDHKQLNKTARLLHADAMWASEAEKNATEAQIKKNRN